jgi:rubrerythrin
VDALNRYQQIATPETPAREVFARLLHEVSQEPDVAQKSEKWIIDTAKELDEVAKGNTREDNQQLKR